MEETNKEEIIIYNRLTFVKNWIDNNPGTDPNAYELVQLAIAVSKYKQNKGELSENIDTLLTEIWSKRSADLLNPTNDLNIKEDSPLFLTLDEIINKAIDGEEITLDNYQEEALELACGISLYMKQRKRKRKKDGFVEPYNIDEQLRLITLQNQVLPKELGENFDKLIEEVNEEYDIESKEQKNKEEITSIEKEDKLEVTQSIYSEINQLEARLDFVQEWISSNTNTDPNAYELAELCILVSQCTSDPNIDRSITESAEAKLNKIWEIRSKDFFNRGLDIKSGSPVFKTLIDLKNKALSGERIVSSKSQEEAIKMACGVGLYIQQQRRDLKNVEAIGSEVYNNSEEMKEIQNLYKDDLGKSVNDEYDSIITSISGCYYGITITGQELREKLKKEITPIKDVKYEQRKPAKELEKSRDSEQKQI